MKIQHRYTLLICALLAIFAGSWGAAILVAQDAEIYTVPAQPGLYRDLDGNLWCGGTCGPEQRCCVIQEVEG
jgi:hypothetical protein